MLFCVSFCRPIVFTLFTFSVAFRWAWRNFTLSKLLPHDLNSLVVWFGHFHRPLALKRKFPKHLCNPRHSSKFSSSLWNLDESPPMAGLLILGARKCMRLFYWLLVFSSLISVFLKRTIMTWSGLVSSSSSRSGFQQQPFLFLHR